MDALTYKLAVVDNSPDFERRGVKTHLVDQNKASHHLQNFVCGIRIFSMS